MKSTLKNVLTLTIITLVAGFLLGYVYEVTKEPIELMAQKTKQEANEKVFEKAVSFASNDSYNLDELQSAIEAKGISGVDINEVLDALDANGNLIGYVFTTTSHEGYGGNIQISMGVDLDGVTLGVEILDISETAGLGMKAKSDDFRNQFKNKQVNQFAYTKSGAGADFEIDAISGATITTNAFTNAVNAALACFEHLGG